MPSGPFLVPIEATLARTSPFWNWLSLRATSPCLQNCDRLGKQTNCFSLSEHSILFLATSDKKFSHFSDIRTFKFLLGGARCVSDFPAIVVPEPVIYFAPPPLGWTDKSRLDFSGDSSKIILLYGSLHSVQFEGVIPARRDA